MLCIVTALIVALPAMNDGELAPANVWNYALYRTLETGLGIVVSLVVNAVLWPNYAGPKLRALMDGAMRTCDQLLAAYLGDQFAARPSAGALDELARETNGALIGSGPLLHFALRDTKAVGRRQAAYEAALNQLRELLGAVSELHAGRATIPLGRATAVMTPALSHLGAAVQAELAALHRAWADGSAEPPPPADFAAADAGFLAAYDSARHGDVFAGEMARMMGVRTALGDVWRVLQSLRLSLAATNGPVALQRSIPKPMALPGLSQFARGQRMHLAIKAGLAVTAGVYLNLFTNTPGGQGLAIAALFYVVITVLVRYQPSIPLTLGMLTGSAMAGLMLYWVFPLLDSFGTLAIALLPGLLFWGWLGGNPRYAAVSLLGTVLFVYSFDLTEHQTYSLQNYTSLVVGQVVGVALSAMCLIIPWPRYPHRELRTLAARFWECARDVIGVFTLAPPWPAETRTLLLARERALQVLPSRTAEWLNDLHPGRFPRAFRARLCAHLAAAQDVGLQLCALIRAREELQTSPLFELIDPHLDRIRAACRAEFEALREAFLHQLPPPPPADVIALSRVLAGFLEQERAAGRTFVYPVAEIGNLLAVVERYEGVARELLAARAALEDGDYRRLGGAWFL
jgi:uncharacterized membrane protein YccC